MKVVILAGGLGTRISEETDIKPKPMVEIGGRPILWHIMKMYAAHGMNDFIICLGYKGYVIKEFFSNYFLHTADVTFDLKNNQMEVHNHAAEPWRVTLVDTGDSTMTGGRLKRVASYVGGEDFCFTYGDGLSDVDISSVIQLHQQEKRLATVTAVQPPNRFGVIQAEESRVKAFTEKPQAEQPWVNGGFFVLSSQIFDHIDGDDTVWEQAPMRELAARGEMSVYYHQGFWQPMDTLREKKYLENLWMQGQAPWRVWG